MKNTSKTIESKIKKNNNAKGFGISKDQLEKIRDNIRSENIEFLKNNVLNLHHADIADIFEILSEEDRKLLAVYLENSLPAEVLASLDEQVLAEILDNYKPGILGDLIGDLDTDEAVYVIENIDIDRREALIKQIPSEERKLIKQALEFPEMSAGRLMQRDYVAVPKYWNVGQVIDYLEVQLKFLTSFILYLLLILGIFL